jgi:outer membrane receptor protein involved in Fe transport
MNTNRRLIDRQSNVLAAAIFCALVSMQAGAADLTAPAAVGAAAPAEEGVAPDSADATADSATASIKGVVVKAQKREQAAIDVPASVTAIDARRLAKSGATQLEDYSAQVPGMAITSNGGSVQVILRGISTGLSQAAPTTGIYIDEAPIGSANNYAVGSGLAPDIDPAELEQIEVLKGPQGTLFGGGAMGGVLRYVTRLPDFNKFSGTVTVGGNSVDEGDNGNTVRFSLNMPASENLALRVSGFQRKDAGYIDNPAAAPQYDVESEDINGVRTTGGRVAVAWKLSDAWRLDAFALTQRREGDAGNWVDVDRDTLEPVGDGYNHSIVVGENGTNDLDVFNGTLHGSIGSFGFVSSTTWQENSADARGDATQAFGLYLFLVTGDPFFGVQQHQVVNTKRFSQEFRLDNTAFDDKLFYSFGLYYTDEDSTNRIPSFPTISLLTGEPKTVFIPGTSIPFPDQLAVARIDSSYRELSFFANATYTFNDKFDLQGGIRYGHDKQHFEQEYSGLIPFPGVFSEEDASNNKFQYLVTGRYHANENSSIYARVATGYRPGGPSAATPLVPNADFTVGPDSLTSFELGWKTVAWDDRLSFELAGFHTDWKDIIIQTNFGSTQYFVNGGKAVSQGWESTLGLTPVEGLNLRGTIAYTDAQLTEDTEVLVAPGVPLGADGDRLPFVPEWTSSLVADYSWAAFGDWTATIGGSVNYVGERQSNYSGRGAMDVPSYTTVNASMSLQNEHWLLTLYGKNLNNSDGIIYLLDRALVPALQPNVPMAAGILRPRTIGVDITYRF